MKTTLNIDKTVMAELKREAARQGRTTSEMVESALRLLFHAQRKCQSIPTLPKFRGGGAVVNIADRDAYTKRWKAGSFGRSYERPCLRR
jgi:ribbon-helix-helix CopG family protein